MKAMNGIAQFEVGDAFLWFQDSERKDLTVDAYNMNIVLKADGSGKIKTLFKIHNKTRADYISGWHTWIGFLYEDDDRILFLGDQNED